jgi:hypothetical protein
MPQESKSAYNRETCTPMFTAEQLPIAKSQNKPRCPTTKEWIKKIWVVYTMEYYAAIKNEIMSFAGNWMELEIITLIETSQTQKEK